MRSMNSDSLEKVAHKSTQNITIMTEKLYAEGEKSVLTSERQHRRGNEISSAM